MNTLAASLEVTTLRLEESTDNEAGMFSFEDESTVSPMMVLGLVLVGFLVMALAIGEAHRGGLPGSVVDGVNDIKSIFGAR